MNGTQEQAEPMTQQPPTYPPPQQAPRVPQPATRLESRKSNVGLLIGTEQVLSVLQPEEALLKLYERHG